MDIRKLNRIRDRLNSFRGKGGIRPRKLEALARALGRSRVKRGKEPTWENKEIAGLRPLTIPHHSTELNKYTADSILDQLEGDIERIEEELRKVSKGGERK
jgi:hypothetical protein